MLIGVHESERIDGMSCRDSLTTNAEFCAGIPETTACITCLDAIANQVFGTAACAAQTPPESAPPVLNSTLLIIADDGTFLGVASDNSFDPDSIANQFGDFGNRFSSTSIWNEFGTYGNRVGALSAWDEFTNTPPILVTSDGVFIAYITANQFLTPRFHPAELAVAAGRTDVLR